MHRITRQLFLFNAVLLAGCRSRTVKTLMPTGQVDVAYMERLYSMRASKSGRRVVLKNRWNTLEIEERSRNAWINGVKVWLHYPSQGAGRTCSLHPSDFGKVIDPILRAYAHLPHRVPRVIVLDPGHGGKDPGAIGPSKVYEKTVVLDIAHRAKKLLSSRGYKVYLTRTGDTFPGLSQRSDYAVKAKADLFVSIHADGAGAASANGVETFSMAVAGGESTNYYGQGCDTALMSNNKFDVANAALGYQLQTNMLKASGRKDRGLRHARYSVLRHAPCPAALVECGFVTNPAEESLLNSVSYRDRVARGITNGVLGYITLVKNAR